MKSNLFTGVFPALTTKFTLQDELDISLFLKNLGAQVEAGVQGIILGGSLGEASVLDNDEKERLVKETLHTTEGKLPVVLNIAEGATREAVKQAERATAWGVHGLMVLPPMRYKTDHKETINWFATIASNTALPIMIYNNPVDYKTEVTLDVFDALQEYENIVAVKESTRDISNVTRMKNRFGDRYKILCGVDTLALESLLMGADGWVAGLVCAFPRETMAVYNLVKAGELEKARAIYQWFLPLLELDIHSKLVQYIKLAETATGLGSEYVRAPRLPLEGAERERVWNIIQEGIRKRPVELIGK
jgi:1-pyrroline-4-hydroxy-2-carboxylate deaminase